ncbi:MAG: hypothetical protein R3B47_10465 [Bacteroidia bacterium]
MIIRHIPIILLLLLFSVNLPLFAQDTLDLGTAVKSGALELKNIRCNGGYQGEKLQLLLTNTSRKKMVLHLPAGQQFPSEDVDEQDLIHTQDRYIEMMAGNTRSVGIFTMCTQASNMSPRQGSSFQLGSLATGGLLAVAQTIAADNYQSSTAQSAVWAVSSGRPLDEIYARDTAMALRLARVASEALGREIPVVSYTPREHRITSIRTSINIIPQEHVTQGKLVAVDSAGREGYVYFTGKKLEAGFYQFRLGLNHTNDPESAFWLRFYDGDKLVSERKVSPTDTITPTMDVRTTVKMSFEIEDKMPVSVGVYDAEGLLYYYISEKAIVTPGTHNSTFQIGKNLPEGVEFWVVVKDTSGTEIAREKMDPEKPMETLFNPIKRQGYIDFQLDEAVEGGSLGVYREDGELVRYLFTNARLNPGKKQYTYKFMHREGPDAKFTIKLVDAEGKVVYEEAL